MKNEPTEPIRTDAGPIADSSEQFYGRAVGRIKRACLVCGLVGLVVTLVQFGLRPAVGFLVGAALIFESFRSLVASVEALGDRLVNRESRERGARVVMRFIVRIPLVALVGYAIFVSSPKSFHGFLAGLCVLVPALIFEAVYEAYAALRRGL